jgi:Leucine-rich repeat (LRR) protein
MPDATADVMRFFDVLRARLGDGSCEELSEALATASVLDLSDAGLTTIAPLYGGPGEHFNRLILDGNPIGDASVLRDLPRLVELSARRLGLREVPDLAAVPDLKWLDLAYNQLERVDSERLPPGLRGLAAHGNPRVEVGAVAVKAPAGARLTLTEAAVCARERDWMRERRAITSDEHVALAREGLAPRYPLVDARSTERVSWQPCAIAAPYYRGLW